LDLPASAFTDCISEENAIVASYTVLAVTRPLSPQILGLKIQALSCHSPKEANET
jgi:hypothetical protein